MTPAAGFSRKDRDAAIEADRIARAAAKARVSIFVFEGSDAWQAWIAHRKRTTGIASMPKTWATIDGKRRLGWWCPSLYPPRDAPSPGERSPEAMAQNRETGPPGGIGLASAEDVAELARGG